MKFTKVVMALIAAGGLFIACDRQSAKVEGPVWPSKDKLVVGFSQADLMSTWRTVESDNMRDVARERGYQVVITNAEGDTGRQISDVESLLAQGCNVMVIVAIDADAIKPALEACAAKNVPVVMKARGANGTPGVDYASFVASDFVWEGEQAATFIANEAAKKGWNQIRVVEIQGVIGGTDVRDRSQGFHNIADAKGFETVAQQSANWSRSEAQAVVQNVLQSTGGRIEAIYCHNDEMALGASLALQAAGRRVNEDILLVGVDGMIEALNAIKSGSLSATVTCTPKFAAKIFDVIESGIRGEALPGYVAVDDKLVDITNVDEFFSLGF
ncbi:MAG: ABC transporter substrate-binding protein [Treponema sp.]|jgi:ABC-type sugar transport system substrate-binding protein|nr:ABC transporter substrate-binding protein [Treponema sp.]